jgi:hypothetical protein
MAKRIKRTMTLEQIDAALFSMNSFALQLMFDAHEKLNRGEWGEEGGEYWQGRKDAVRIVLTKLRTELDDATANRVGVQNGIDTLILSSAHQFVSDQEIDAAHEKGY